MRIYHIFFYASKNFDLLWLSKVFKNVNIVDTVEIQEILKTPFDTYSSGYLYPRVYLLNHKIRHIRFKRKIKRRPRRHIGRVKVTKSN